MIDQLLDELIAREGKKDTLNPNDSGGRTKFGISERWNPEAWENGPPTLEAAKAIYLDNYFIKPGFHLVNPVYLLNQLLDFGVLSGPHVAIQHIQKLVGVERDGILGPITRTAIEQFNPWTLNNRLVDDRILMLVRLVQRRPKDLEFLFGWVTRALSFRKD